MLTNLFFSIEIFLLTFCSLNVLKNIFGVIKVIRTREGKFSSSTISTILLGLSISYIITLLIVGF